MWITHRTVTDAVDLAAYFGDDDYLLPNQAVAADGERPIPGDPRVTDGDTQTSDI
ncbi:hypothetical protein [Nocardia mexicana]|uniref:Uncharacterized protein n=1 Tax=Nocardia mexicana TaxID=279262 RepID=A0A370GNN9_9NOCA|nr:hypothetical protein [Nocardia mexicana]RDI43553.1 hypothetical protein DFR68_12020 [Nocardia mexicana]